MAWTTEYYGLAVDSMRAAGRRIDDEVLAHISPGVPLATEAAAMIASYLTAERDLGRIAEDADIDTLAPALIGAGHLLFADRKGAPPEAYAVRKVVTTVLTAVVREPQP